MGDQSEAMGKGGGCGKSSEQKEKERAQKERAEKERAEKERVANLPRMSVNFISPPPAVKFEFNVEETAEGALETIAPHYGLKKSDAPLLQLEFSDTILTPKQQLTAVGMCDESLCSVLGVQAALEKRKAEARKAKAAAKAAAALQARKDKAAREEAAVSRTREAKEINIVAAAMCAVGM